MPAVKITRANTSAADRPEMTRSESDQPSVAHAELLVRGQSEARRLIEEIAPTHILSITTPGRSYLGPRDFASDRQLFVSFDDVDGLNAANAPDAAMIERVLAFSRALPSDGKLLIHGLLGVRRSSAVALGLLADRMSPTDAAQSLTPLCSQPPDPHPLVLRLFDILRSRGMIAWGV